MSQDPFIKRMMAATFEGDDAQGAKSNSRLEHNFHLRRNLARLPVMAFEGHWTSPGLARFIMHGKSIDIPAGHDPVQGWATPSGDVSKKSPFTEVCGALLNCEFSHMFSVQSEDGHPWIIMWDEADEQIDVFELRDLFRATKHLQKAA